MEDQEKETLELMAQKAPEHVMSVANELLELLADKVREIGIKPWHTLAIAEVVMARAIQLSVRPEYTEKYFEVLGSAVKIIFVQLSSLDPVAVPTASTTETPQ